jgi:uncharacterized iron-regulated membrane protein
MITLKRSKGSGMLRIFRKLHNISGLTLAGFIFIIAVSGILLGWKKNSFDYLLPKTQTGTTGDLSLWLPLDSLHSIAVKTLAAFSPELSPEVDRIDIRENSGVVKFDFKNHYYGIQLDGATGKALDISLRRSDFIEDLHDGSYLDKIFSTQGEILKIIYTSIMGLAMILFTITGIYIYSIPRKRMKRFKSKRLLMHKWRFQPK